jgi:hypothetical protein
MDPVRLYFDARVQKRNEMVQFEKNSGRVKER